jgi:hypothetical protein
MLKISQTGKPHQCFTLQLEGSIVGPWVNELRLVCESILSHGRTLALDLADVSYADVDGVKLLIDLKSRGVKLPRISPFVNEQLKTV